MTNLKHLSADYDCHDGLYAAAEDVITNLDDKIDGDL